jgi:hypothetical protein
MMARALVSAALLALLASAVPAAAQPYRWIDERGNVHYADSPPRNPPASLENLNPAARYRRIPPAGASDSPDAKTAVPAQVPARPAPAPPGKLPSHAPARPAVSPPRAPAPTDAVPQPATPPRAAPPAPSAPRPESPRPRPAPSGPAPARPAPPPPIVPTDTGDAIHELMALSGMESYLDGLATRAREEFVRRRWRLADPESAWAGVARGFHAEALAATARRTLENGLSAADREALLAWFRSPLVARARRLQHDASSAAQAAQYRAFVSRLADAPPPATRVARVQWFERQARMAKFQTEVTHAVRDAVQRVLAPLTVRGRRGAVEEDDGRIGAEEEDARFFYVTMMLFAYRTLSDEELDEAAHFAASPLGTRFTALTRESVRAALRAAEQDAMAALRAPSPGGARS